MPAEHTTILVSNEAATMIWLRGIVFGGVENSIPTSGRNVPMIGKVKNMRNIIKSSI